MRYFASITLWPFHQNISFLQYYEFHFNKISIGYNCVTAYFHNKIVVDVQNGANIFSAFAASICEMLMIVMPCSIIHGTWLYLCQSLVCLIQKLGDPLDIYFLFLHLIYQVGRYKRLGICKEDIYNSAPQKGKANSLHICTFRVCSKCPKN